jgi:hypothetical protein
LGCEGIHRRDDNVWYVSSLILSGNDIRNSDDDAYDSRRVLSHPLLDGPLHHIVRSLLSRLPISVSYTRSGDDAKKLGEDGYYSQLSSSLLR